MELCCVVFRQRAKIMNTFPSCESVRAVKMDVDGRSLLSSTNLHYELKPRNRTSPCSRRDEEYTHLTPTTKTNYLTISNTLQTNPEDHPHPNPHKHKPPSTKNPSQGHIQNRTPSLPPPFISKKGQNYIVQISIDI